MAIFNSYVKLPEGKHETTQLDVFTDDLSKTYKRKQPMTTSKKPCRMHAF